MYRIYSNTGEQIIEINVINGMQNWQKDTPESQWIAHQTYPYIQHLWYQVENNRVRKFKIITDAPALLQELEQNSNHAITQNIAVLLPCEANRIANQIYITRPNIVDLLDVNLCFDFGNSQSSLLMYGKTTRGGRHGYYQWPYYQIPGAGAKPYFRSCCLFIKGIQNEPRVIFGTPAYHLISSAQGIRETHYCEHPKRLMAESSGNPYTYFPGVEPVLKADGTPLAPQDVVQLLIREVLQSAMQIWNGASENATSYYRVKNFLVSFPISMAFQERVILYFAAVSACQIFVNTADPTNQIYQQLPNVRLLLDESTAAQQIYHYVRNGNHDAGQYAVNICR